MTSHDNDRPALFLTTPNTDGPDGQAVAFDGSAEAMRRLRHPFAVNPAGEEGRAAAGDNSERRG
ncbi:hypothetical protein [Micromonospora halophytica]|uniref:Uncharacterized protein n=1 Tax=Micromonospora halophytica TaxID=47864 RepID=A0A1C5IWK8_9ACTN|nr:hypothetical protein [Micromonospora halophytica]SCG62349.1 hypothetical protein GA0070560_11730 [Micromonospora halophytica]